MLQLTINRKAIREPNGEERIILEGLTLDIRNEDTSIAIAGRSGSGKTTLLRILAGLDTRYDGSYVFENNEIDLRANTMAAHRLKNIGIVTQRYDLLNDRDVLHNVLLGAPTPRSYKAQAAAALEQVGLGHYAKKKVSQLSGGEAQRVAIARALVKKPLLLLADEPTGALDERTEDRVLQLFQEIEAQGTTVIYATHSARVMRASGRIMHLTDRSFVSMQAP